MGKEQAKWEGLSLRGGSESVRRASTTQNLLTEFIEDTTAPEVRLVESLKR